MLSDRDAEYLARQLGLGQVILFTGAGFSVGARARDGSPLPLGQEVAKDLWSLAFPGDAFDPSSTLSDLFDLALRSNRRALDNYLHERFAVDQASLPKHFETWFSAPWSRIYTLNVDDLESAAARAFGLPRTVVSRSALETEQSESPRTESRLEIVHLNGMAMNGATGVTFATTQYGQRIPGTDAFYPQLVAELVSHPCIFVGTVLDESPLWQHVELRGVRGPRGAHEFRRRSFLVTRDLPKARAALLEQFNVCWVQGTAEEFAEKVLGRLHDACRAGLSALAVAKRGPGSRIPLVSELARARGSSTGSIFLLGDEPQWSDITDGRAIERTCDLELRTVISRIPGPVRDAPGHLIVITGTAGSGKSTTLMRLALHQSASGADVGWVDDDVDVSPRDIQRFARTTSSKLLCINDAERYGSELAPIITQVLQPGGVGIVAVAIRAHLADRVLPESQLAGIPKTEIPVPPLADPDIEGLIAVLDAHNLLGRLKGLSHAERVAAFREQADRQLLVAMLQATSGRLFEEKVMDEWDGLGRIARNVYGLVGLAYSSRVMLDRDQVLVAIGEDGNEVLNALDLLVRRHILVRSAEGRIRTRHQLVAEILVEGLMKHHHPLTVDLYGRLAFAVAMRSSPRLARTSRPRREVKTLLNHERLYRLFAYNGACAVYDAVAEVLNWDYHFHLQRGSLELAYGAIRLAETYLEAAHSLEADDPRVTTAYAYMLMKKAIASPTAPRAFDWAEKGMNLLTDQVRSRGAKDPYPYHVLGSQGLSWARRAPCSEDERVDLLKRLIKFVEQGHELHPRKEDLARLVPDLKRELLSRALGRDPTAT